MARDQHRLRRGVIALGVILGAACSGDVDPLRRTVAQGILEGYQDEATGALVWKGIPFASPPVGDLRWRAPQEPAPWDGVRSAVADVAPCAQLEVDEAWVSQPNAVGSEDCLYLNVYRPAGDEAGLPVYVWIHGGANIAGDADTYDLENLATKGNLVAVVLQYRMNVFGFFTHPALRHGTPAERSGNFGTLDQIRALEWVRDNITAFGGDPANVTVAGESAGGHDIMGLMISPLAAGLFHRAVMQSGGMVSQSVEATDAIADRTIDSALVMQGLATDSMHARTVRGQMDDAEISAFLAGLDAAELIQAHAGGPGRTEIPVGNLIEDGTVIPGDLLCTIERGQYMRVPIMAGATAQEMGVIAPFLYEGLSDVVRGTRALGDVLTTEQARLEWQKIREYGSAFWRATMVDELVRRMATHQTDVYVYAFDWGRSGVLPEPLEEIYGAAHSIEIPFFQGNADAEGVADWLLFRGFTAANRPGRLALSDAIVAWQAAFMRTGNPNDAASGLPEWRPWTNTPGAPRTLHLDADPANAHIRMDTDELTVADVRRALDAEPPAVQRAVRAFLETWTPWADYRPGDYAFGVCN